MQEQNRLITSIQSNMNGQLDLIEPFSGYCSTAGEQLSQNKGRLADRLGF